MDKPYSSKKMVSFSIESLKLCKKVQKPELSSDGYNHNGKYGMTRSMCMESTTGMTALNILETEETTINGYNFTSGMIKVKMMGNENEAIWNRYLELQMTC